MNQTRLSTQYRSRVCWSGCFLLIGGFLAPAATADPIRYTTEGVGTPEFSFQGTSGTFEPGSEISLGRFVIAAPEPGLTTRYDNTPFTIELKTPDFDQPVPADAHVPYPTTIESSVLIRGRVSGAITSGEPPMLGVVYDSVELGGLGPYLLGHVQKFTFPIPIADVKLPEGRLILIPTDTWEHPQLRMVEVKTQITPEPATWAAWGLVGLGALAARRRTRTAPGKS